MKSFLASIPLALGIMLGCALAGWYLRGCTIVTGPPRTIVIDRPVVIPSKKDQAIGKPIRPDAERINLQDRLIGMAVLADSLEEYAETLSTPWQATVEDMIAVKDSLGSFYTRRIDTLDIDPIKRLISRRISYLDSKLTTVKIEQTIAEGESWFQKLLYWLERAAWFLLGHLTGKI